MANIITCIRIACSFALLFFPAQSAPFYILYLIAGLTDMIDGVVARKTHTASEPGAKLDTAADFVLVAVCFIKLIPVLNIPLWLYIWIGAIGIIKTINIVYAFWAQKRLAFLHRYANKATGAMLFALPFTLNVIDIKFSSIIVCFAATYAAIQEMYYINEKRIISKAYERKNF